MSAFWNVQCAGAELFANFPPGELRRERQNAPRNFLAKISLKDGGPRPFNACPIYYWFCCDVLGAVPWGWVSRAAGKNAGHHCLYGIQLGLLEFVTARGAAPNPANPELKRGFSPCAPGGPLTGRSESVANFFPLAAPEPWRNA